MCCGLGSGGLPVGFDLQRVRSSAKEASVSVPRTDPGRVSRLSRRPASARSSQQRRGPGAAILLVFVPLLCCGGPLVLGVLATASAAILGTIGGIVGTLMAAVAVAVWVRHRRRRGTVCCPPLAGGRQP